MEKDSFQNGINHLGAGQPAGAYQNVANHEGRGQLPTGPYQNVANHEGGGQLPGGSYQNVANYQGGGQLATGSYSSYANNQWGGQLSAGSYPSYANNQWGGQLAIGPYPNYTNNQWGGQLSAGSYPNYANNQGGGQLSAGSYQNYANQLQQGSYQNDANHQGTVQSSAGSYQSFANDEGALPLQSESYQNDVIDQGVQQLPIGSYQNDTHIQGNQLAQMNVGLNDGINQETNLNLTEVNNEGVQGKRKLYLNEDYNQEEQQPQTEQKPASALVEKIQQLGVTNVPQVPADSRIHCLTIVGQIEGHLTLPPQNKTTKYEHLIPQLVAIEQNPKIEGVLILLNTVGGDVEAGLAISEMLATISKPTVSIVLGGGHSIGVPIAVSCDYSFIAETATMTIHPVRLTGLVISVPQTFEYLDKMQERVVSFVTKHSNISEEKFKKLMFATGNLTQDIGTNVIGAEAVEAGLIDEVGGLGHAMKKLNEMVELQRQKNEGLIQ